MVKMRDVAVVSADAPRTLGWLRLVMVSDTHNVDLPLSLFPAGDLLIHAGDHTQRGLLSELEGAAVWLRSLTDRYTYGVLSVAGNHDKPLDTETWPQAASLSQPDENWDRALMATVRDWFDGEAAMRLLQQSEAEIAGLRFFGSPYVRLTPRRQKMDKDHPCRYEGFGRDPEQLVELYAEIPEGLDVLITHSPPFGILDASVQYAGVPREAPIAIGSAALRDRLREMPPDARPRLHVFGHEHDGRGVHWDEALGMLFVNAAAVNGDQGFVKKGGDYAMKEGFHPWVIDIKTQSFSRQTHDPIQY